jgi:hypothetical protein
VPVGFKPNMSENGQTRCSVQAWQRKLGCARPVLYDSAPHNSILSRYEELLIIYWYSTIALEADIQTYTMACLYHINLPFLIHEFWAEWAAWAEWADLLSVWKSYELLIPASLLCPCLFRGPNGDPEGLCGIVTRPSPPALVTATSDTT